MKKVLGFDKQNENVLVNVGTSHIGRKYMQEACAKLNSLTSTSIIFFPLPTVLLHEHLKIKN